MLHHPKHKTAVFWRRSYVLYTSRLHVAEAQKFHAFAGTRQSANAGLCDQDGPEIDISMGKYPDNKGRGDRHSTDHMHDSTLNELTPLASSAFYIHTSCLCTCHSSFR